MLWSLLCLLLPLVGVVSGTSNNNNTVDVSLVANWHSTPYKLNVLHSTLKFDSEFYIPLVAKLLGLSVPESSEDEDEDEDGVEVNVLDDYSISDKDYYEFAVSHMDSASSKALLGIRIANRIDSPAVEAHYQHYRQDIEPQKLCPGRKAFIVQGENVYCEPTDVYALKTPDRDTSDALQSFDIRVGNSTNFFLLYGDYESADFREMFASLFQSAITGKLSYAWRYVPDESTEDYEILGGYGADLTLKRTDYIVIDDRGLSDEQKEKMKFDESESVLSGPESVSAGDHFWEDYYDSVPKLNKEDLETLDLKLTKFILDHPGEDKVELLTKIVQDFPKFAAKIAALPQDDKAVQRLAVKVFQESQLNIPQGFYINDASITKVKMDVFEVMKVLQRELKRITDWKELGLSPAESNRLLSAFTLQEYNFEKLPFRRYDVSAYSDAVVYFNNVEKDRQYAQLVSAPEAYSQEPELGQLPPARENIYDTIFIFDLTDPVRLYYTLSVTNQILTARVPERVGIVPFASTPLGTRASEQFLRIASARGSNEALEYLHTLNMYVSEDKLTEEVLDSFDVPEGNEPCVASVASFLKKFQIDTSSVIVNGVIAPYAQDLRFAVKQLSSDMYYLLESFNTGKIPAGMKFRDFLYKGALNQRIPHLIPDNIQAVEATFAKTPSVERYLDLVKRSDDVATVVGPKGKSPSPKTLALMGSFENPKFRDQIVEAIQYLSKSGRTKLRIVDTGRTDEFQKLQPLLDSDLQEAIRFVNNTEIAGESTGHVYVCVNGRVVDVSAHSVVTVDQFSTLVSFEQDMRLKLLWKRLNHEKSAKAAGKHLFADTYDWFEYMSWIVSDTYFNDGEEFVYEGLPRYSTNLLDDSLAIHVPATKEPLIYVALVIDPISELAQKCLAMLPLFSNMASFVDLKVYLRPSEKMESIEIKRLYRGNFQSGSVFNEDGTVQKDPLKIKFDNVPEKALFTTNIDDPQSWIVTIKEANADLDNVKLDLSGPVTAVYELSSLLVEGYARQGMASSRRPVGVPVELVNSHGEVYSDTNVMANFGYFQLKANPGRWDLQIKSHTKGSDIYFLSGMRETVGGGFDEVQDSKYPLYVLDLNGLIVFPVFLKKAGKEEESLVDVGGREEAKQGNALLNKLKSGLSFMGGKKKAPQADINIFAVASGHLYERLLGIMTASVMAHTEHSVKFWLIENYMSPQLKRDLPALAEHFGFTYELVMYKWPAWLAHQREKQRVIWGYKILFLDVLFPQDLGKVIFVDSDQIVRTDMMDLVNLDLEGAPYGFTPMCDSREEMEGFRFWKKGYWKDMLGDKYKYHISALYVVDLEKFRKIAAGDILRQQYQQLSQDPESLSNLDQDLPNNLQEVLPIHSLPQNWLWCETWCSDEGLKDARTIDLCNNPLTKEPKLARARRQIPEWTDYDDEISNLVGGSSPADEASKEVKHDEL